MRVHRLSVVVCAGLAVAGIASAVASASSVVKYDSEVTISSHAPAFHGRVKSEKNACERHRKVKLYKQRHGPDKLLGKDKTNRHGKWEVKDRLRPGFFYAKVVRRVKGTAPNRFVCRGSRSLGVLVSEECPPRRVCPALYRNP